MLSPRTLLAPVALVAGFMIAGCGGSSNSSDHATVTTVTVTDTTPPPPTTTAATRTVTTTTVTSPTTTTATTTTGATGQSAACVAADLTPHFLGTNGAAGTIAIGFALKNTSAAACHTYGWPGVLFVSSSGASLPTNAQRTSSDMLGSTPATEITLQPGQEASFRMVASQFAESSNTTCQNASTLQIIAPDDTATLRVSLNGGVPACGKATVSPLMAGTSAWPNQ